MSDAPAERHDWTRAEVEALFERPFNDLLFEAQSIHRSHFDPNRVQISTLLSIKTGACPEDCAYCPQSIHHNTHLERERLLPVEEVVEAARAARDNGATRFCMGAAWRNPTDRNLERVIEMVQAVRDLGMETCVTLGMLHAEQARRLAEAGLDYYNHNLDSSPEYYERVISTRSYSDRQETLANVRDAGINVCCGGIIGMARSAMTAPACSSSSPTSPSIRARYRSTCSSRFRARRCTAWTRSTHSSSCAPSPSPAS
jgi:biotin synthase